jgi:hypothetical protein
VYEIKITGSAYYSGAGVLLQLFTLLCRDFLLLTAVFLV